MKHAYALGLFLALSVVPSVSAVRAAEPPSVVISEIAWAGSQKSTADEWIEIRNTGTEALDLSGWSLTGVGSSGSIITIPDATSLSGGSTYLIANYALDDPKSTLVVEPNLVTTAVSIPNTSLNITLLDAAGVIIDSLSDPGTPDFGSSATFSTIKRDLTTMTWFSEETSTNVFHEAVETEEPATSSEPIASSIESEPQAVTIPDPIDAESVATDPIILDPVVEETVAVEELVATEEPTTIPDADVTNPPPNDNNTPEPIMTETIVTDVISDDPITVSEPVSAVDERVVEPPKTENPVVVEIPLSPVVPETPITTAFVVIIEEPEPTVTVPSASSEAIETIPEVPVIPISSVKVGDVIISEILPSPSAGNDEWVELQNMTNIPQILDNLTLIDASGKVTNLGGTIAANGYALIPNPNGKLNNESDGITLMNDNIVLDSVSYGDDTNPAPKKDVALARINGVWIATTPTPAKANSETLTPTLSPTLYVDTPALALAEQTTITTSSNESPRSSSAPSVATSHVVAAVQSIATADPAPASVSIKATSTSPKSAKKKAPKRKKVTTRSVTIEEIATLADGTKVRLEGVVVATTGVLGKRSFFIDGLEIYQNNGALADVSVGDYVVISGEVSVLSAYRRINIQEGAVLVIDHADPVVHDYASTLPYGSLTRITGTVSARDGNTVLLNTDHGTITLVPGNGVTITWTDLAGATITATGILKHGDQETLVLRSNTDVVMQQNDETLLAATIASTATSQSSLLWMTGILLAVCSAGFGVWVWYTRPKVRLPKLILHPNSI